MAEKLSEVWECYDMEIQSLQKGRGMVLLHTNHGIRALNQLNTSESRLEQEAMLTEALYQAGYTMVDRLVRNQDQELITCDKYHTPHVLREYFEGKECNIRLESDMLDAMENLGRLHLALRKLPVPDEVSESKVLHGFERHNREMKRVQIYMRSVATKSAFDYLYLANVKYFLDQGQEVVKQLASMQEIMKGDVYYCHGAYHQHNVLLCRDGVATVNFEHFTVDYQLVDLYTFLRKAMEKNDYDSALLFRLIEAYNRLVPLNQQDILMLYYLLWYPEKFWKITNQYNNMNKAWIPPKIMEKLETVISQETKKMAMLRAYQREYA